MNEMKIYKRVARWPRARVAAVPPLPPGPATIPVPELRRLVAEMID
jgi:hypothetical protein